MYKEKSISLNIDCCETDLSDSWEFTSNNQQQQFEIYESIT